MRQWGLENSDRPASQAAAESRRHIYLKVRENKTVEKLTKQNYYH